MESFVDMYITQMYALGMFLKVFFCYLALMMPYPDKNLYDKSKSISLDIFYTNVFFKKPRMTMSINKYSAGM